MKVAAFAKLNLTLEVLGRRADGYHNISTVMQAVDLADELEICPAADLQVECSEPALGGKGNLVWQAAAALAESCGRRPGAQIYINKAIPVGRGLGGGSSDAAAALLALNRWWELNRPLSELCRIAAGLGSDVPYFLQGGAAWVEGRGEQVAPLPTKPGVGVILICPGQTLENKTKRMYGQLTAAHYSDGGITRRMVENLLAGRLDGELLHNVFTEPALPVFPGLAALYNRVGEIAGRRPQLTGAGPALFLLPAAESDYLRLANALHPEAAAAYFVRTRGRATDGAVNAAQPGNHPYP